MAVLIHEVHEKTKEGSEARWGCWNRPKLFSRGYWAPNRSYCQDESYIDEQVFVQHFGSHECRNDISLTDPKCEGCNHRGSGEAYSQMIRAKGAA